MSPNLRPYAAAFGFIPLGLLAISAANAQTLYSFGNPTADEQYYIELINRARANPSAEGARLASTTDPDVLNAYSYFSVSLPTMQNEFNAIAPAPPLAPNGSLTSAARGHSQWMLENEEQSHDETTPDNNTGDRIDASGYEYLGYGENVFAYAKNVWHGHAGFQVDWGSGPGGMQSPRGHRNSIHNPDYREIGVGVVNGNNGTVGPQLVTQDFGIPYDLESFDTPSFGTGVAYYDLNSNNFYDVGEGIQGLTVNVNGAAHYCVTAVGGGWTVPIPEAAATRAVTFSGLGINQSRNLIVPEDHNAKADLKLTYSPPSITSPAAASANSAQSFTFTAVGGATGYRWDRWSFAPSTTENCESLANVTPTITGSYNVLNTAVKQQGAASFHLMVTPGAVSNQILELTTLFHGSSTPSLSFQSRLRLTTPSHRHMVQVKIEGSGVWQEVYNQGGGTTEAAFSLKNVNLTAMVGKTFRVRFLLNPQGSTYDQTGDDFGWFIDTISFTGMSTLTNPVTQNLTGTSGSYNLTAGNYLLSIAPIISGLTFPASIQKLTVSTPAVGFASWAASVESANSLAAGTIANNPQADLDMDGLANLVEYAFGTSPVTGNEATPRMPAIQNSATHFILRYVRDVTLSDISLQAVAGSDLVGWNSPGQAAAPAGFTDTQVSTTGNLETREAKIPFASGYHFFMRVRVTKP